MSLVLMLYIILFKSHGCKGITGATKYPILSIQTRLVNTNTALEDSSYGHRMYVKTQKVDRSGDMPGMRGSGLGMRQWWAKRKLEKNTDSCRSWRRVWNPSSRSEL